MVTTNGRLEFNETNAELDYATHGFFRYFGKLPPSVIRYILKEGLPDPKNNRFLDIMCGSGTGLVEAKLLGIPAVGVDVNPLSVLISKVKTRVLPKKLLDQQFGELQSEILSDLGHFQVQPTIPGFYTTKQNNGNKPQYIEKEVPVFPNRDYWFSSAVQRDLAIIKHHVLQIESQKLRDFFLVAFLSIIRRVSNASPRVGRIFHIGYDREIDVFSAFVSRCNYMISGLKEFEAEATDADTQIIEADARMTGLASDSFGLILSHPPYFALYKYSSDVLRFELEWGDFDRSKISKSEVRDGFKTTRLEAFEEYAADMADVFREAFRLLKNDSLLCVVVNDSTLREVRLPVAARFKSEAEKVGFVVESHFSRPVKYAQASYHRSARDDKRVEEDSILFFRKS
jgi:DNA modification methylase